MDSIIRIAKAVLLIAGILSLTSCIEWSTNAQGQLQSLGVPGLPVWQSQQLSEQKHLAAEGALAASPGSEIDPHAAMLTSTYSDAQWLADVNAWRTKAGVKPIGENFGLSNGAAEHACYLVKNGPTNAADFHIYEMTIGGAAHTEDPNNQYFTHSGDEAAHTGDVAWDRNPTADVNGLVMAPFHRLTILAPWVRVAGYGDCGRFPMRAATLVLRGSTSVGLTKTIFFPPDGSTVLGEMKNSEWPNPLAACPGYSLPVGTPITVQMGAFVKVSLRSYSVTDETTGQAAEACGFDARNYPITRGWRSLLTYGAVVVIPRRPLVPGHAYSVIIKTHRYSFNWTFSVRGNQKSPGLRSASSEYCLLPDGEDACLDQVKAGMAWHYKQSENEQTPEAASCTHQRRTQPVRPWRDPHPIPPWDFRHNIRVKLCYDQTNHCIACSRLFDGPVRGNRRSRIFEWPGYPFYDAIAQHNRVEFPSARATQQAGYRTARNCP